MNVPATLIKVVLVLGIAVVVVVAVVVRTGTEHPAGLQQHRRRVELAVALQDEDEEKAHRRSLGRKLGSADPPLTKVAHTGGTVSLSNEKAASKVELLLTARMDVALQSPAPHVASHEAPLRLKAHPLGETGGWVGQAEEPQQQIRWNPVCAIVHMDELLARLQRGDMLNEGVAEEPP